MNYEELLAAKTDGKLNHSKLFMGEFYRTKVDNKYRSQIDLKEQLCSNIVFSEGLKHECDANKTLNNNHQLHFEPVMKGNEIVQLTISEMGQYQSYAQLMADNPAIVAQRGFLDTVLEGLVDISEYLHKQNIRHVCYSPASVFARKGDNAPMLLSHGSFYSGMSDLKEFYGDEAQYVAPEVLNKGTVDDRCDVYSIGMFMQSLFSVADMPLEYKMAIKKATSESPEDRYQTPSDLLKAVQKRRGTLRSAMTVVIALVIALIAVWVYFDAFPETSPVEFVKPAPRTPTDDLLDDGFDPEELGVTSSGDSLIVDETVERDYQQKAEEIFRKKYTAEADRILSKIYNKEYMSNAEKKFTAESQSTIDELMKKQAELGSDAGLTPERAQLIATEIIEHITEQKKKEMGNTNSKAIQK